MLDDSTMMFYIVLYCSIYVRIISQMWPTIWFSRDDSYDMSLLAWSIGLRWVVLISGNQWCLWKSSGIWFFVLMKCLIKIVLKLREAENDVWMLCRATRMKTLRAWAGSAVGKWESFGKPHDIGQGPCRVPFFSVVSSSSSPAPVLGHDAWPFALPIRRQQIPKYSRCILWHCGFVWKYMESSYIDSENIWFQYVSISTYPHFQWIIIIYSMECSTSPKVMEDPSICGKKRLHRRWPSSNSLGWYLFHLISGWDDWSWLFFLESWVKLRKIEKGTLW